MDALQTGCVHINTHDAVIRFPDNSNVKPVYVSVSDVLTPEQVKQREEEERRRQQMWNASYPLLIWPVSSASRNRIHNMVR
ncbi:hypothetical protein CPU03_17025 (plasmid) [Edwardsiella tarda]|nr:hypothetical protein CPU03_17025 [Edwardsiella tarda]